MSLETEATEMATCTYNSSIKSLSIHVDGEIQHVVKKANRRHYILKPTPKSEARVDKLEISFVPSGTNKIGPVDELLFLLGLKKPNCECTIGFFVNNKDYIYTCEEQEAMDILCYCISNHWVIINYSKSNRTL